MKKNFSFAVEDIQRINLSEYEDDEFAVAKMGYLSTKPNSHGLKISEKVLRESASTVLNKWLVADMTGIVDAGTHTKEEKIVGHIPKEQDVEFVYDDDGYLRAYVDVVVSKIYAKDFCKIFEEENNRAVSVEMRVLSNEDDENLVESFKIVGVTTLGRQIRPSCPNSDIEFTRFSQEDADKFFAKVHNNSLTVLKKFVEERKESMAEGKIYKIDKSKDAMSETPWGDVDKTELRNKIMDAKNKATLVKAVYMLVEDGWEESPSEHLKYPVMQLKGDTFVYNRYGLSSALAYAQKENESGVVSKVEAIYKKLGLGKEDDAKMAEIKFAAVDIGDMWSRLWKVIDDRHEWDYCICGIYEQDNKKFAILKDRDGNQYRLDFSLTEDGLTVAEEVIKVKTEFIETDDIKKFAEPEGAEKYMQFEIEGRKAWAKVIKKVQNHEGDGAYVDSIEDNHIIYTKDDVRYRVEADIKVDKDDKSVDADIKWDTVKKDADQKMSKTEKMSEDEMMAKITELKKGIKERDNIIMEKDTCMKDMEAELADLREFKKTCMEKDKACAVESVMNEVKDFMNDEQFKALREEGMACEFSQIDAWTNKVKAISFESVKGNKKTTKTSSVMWFSAPVQTEKNENSLWA